MHGSLVLTAMRNEGPFILEWLAWQKMLGFENILVMFNDCTDHSPQLLRLLERAGEVACKRHVPKDGEHPQPSAARNAQKHPLVKNAEWMFTCDVDEFLIIHQGDGTISALLQNGDVPFSAMAIHWRIFGSNGYTNWKDGLVHEQFTHSSRSEAQQNTCFKSIVHHPRNYDRLNTHCTSGWAGTGTWDQSGNYWVLSDGSRLVGFHPDKRPMNATPRVEITHTVAEVNHYAVRTREQYALKKGRPSSTQGLDRYTDDFFRRFDRNEVENKSASTYHEAFVKHYTRLCDLPGVMRLHHLCCADHVIDMCEKRGDDPKMDHRYQYHKKMAQSLPRH